MSGLDVVEMQGVRRTLGDQHGGCSHLTTHSWSPDPLTPSGTSSLTDCMTILVGVIARQQVLVSITLPRSGDLTVAGDRAILWPQDAGRR